jgi:peptidoglycan/xylan/chitin deacetylase (PgdA/CDA1 family)
LAVLAHGIYAPNSPVFGRVIGAGPDPGAVYLSFDDGPNPGVTERILDVLAQARIRAGFFMVGAYVERSPALARRVAEAGHEVGNHTYSHTKLHRLGPARVRAELDRAHRVLSDATGRAPRAFRAPHGYRTPFVTRAARALGYRVFGWSYGVWDSSRPGADEIRRRVRRKLRGGAIVLLHDGDGASFPGDRAQTAAALPGIIEDIRNAGLEPRAFSELLG